MFGKVKTMNKNSRKCKLFVFVLSDTKSIMFGKVKTMNKKWTRVVNIFGLVVSDVKKTKIRKPLASLVKTLI